MEIIKSVKYNEPYESIYKLNIGRSLDEYEAEAAMNKILYEDDIQKRISLLTMLLNGIMIKGPTVNEISGLLNASLGMDNMLNSKKKKINLPNDEVLVGVASSGKKGVKTINITSAACFVAAACGANIAKVCSHSTSSKTGSADFLSICGIDIGIPFDKKVETMAEHHISFFSIEDTTPNFAKVYGGVFYAPHAMSFALAGLSFPVEIDSLAYGISHPNVKLSAEVLKKYNTNNALIYSSTLDGLHYLDELLPAGHVNLSEIKDGIVEKNISVNIQNIFELTSLFNFSNIKESEEKESNIVKSLNILKGNGTEDQVNTICINAAIFLLLGKKTASLEQGYKMAKGIICTDKVWKLFLNVVEAYGGNRENIYNLMERINDTI